MESSKQTALNAYKKNMQKMATGSASSASPAKPRFEQLKDPAAPSVKSSLAEIAGPELKEKHKAKADRLASMKKALGTEEQKALPERLEKTVETKSGARKSAELLLLMGKEAAANALKHMSAAEIEEVTAEIAQINTITAQEANETLTEFGRPASKSSLFHGGADVARSFLQEAFDSFEAQRILRNAVPDLVDKPFVFLEDLEFNQLAGLLKNESIETLAVILPWLKPKTAKKVVEALPVFDQPPLIKRIASAKRVDASVIARIENVLRERIRKQGGRVETEELDGRQTLADILRFMSIDEEKHIIANLAQTEPETAHEIEQQLITLESLFLMADRDLQNIFYKKDENEIAILLKGKKPEIRNRILSAMSSKRAEMVLNEEKILGPMRKSDIDKATREFLDSLREQERQGKITFLRPGETFL